MTELPAFASPARVCAALDITRSQLSRLVSQGLAVVVKLGEARSAPIRIDTAATLKRLGHMQTTRARRRTAAQRRRAALEAAQVDALLRTESEGQRNRPQARLSRQRCSRWGGRIL